MSHFIAYINEATRTAPRWKRLLFHHAPHPIARRVNMWNREEMDRALERDRQAEGKPVSTS